MDASMRGSGQKKALEFWEAGILGSRALVEWRVSTWKPYSKSLMNKTEAYGRVLATWRKKSCRDAWGLKVQDGNTASQLTPWELGQQPGHHVRHLDPGPEWDQVCGRRSRVRISGELGKEQTGERRRSLPCPQLSSKTWNGRRALGKVSFRNPLLFAPEEAKPTC